MTVTELIYNLTGITLTDTLGQIICVAFIVVFLGAFLIASAMEGYGSDDY